MTKKRGTDFFRELINVENQEKPIVIWICIGEGDGRVYEHGDIKIRKVL